jgi:hypothetical protein
MTDPAPGIGPSGPVVPPAPGTAAHRLQRAVLLELLCLRDEADADMAELAKFVETEPLRLRAAVAELVEAGLAEADGDAARATAAARYLDALWPIVI